MSEQAIAMLAERQHAVVATRQIRDLGGDRHLVKRRVQQGRWERVAPGVVRFVGSPRTPEQLLMVAVLRAGPEALAASHSGGWLWRLPGFADVGSVIRPRSHGDVAARGHRPMLLLPHHRTVVEGIPVTSLPRTIFDLAGVVRLGRLTALVDTVVTRSPSLLPILHSTLDELAQRGRPGITAMRAVLRERPVGTAVPATGLERRFETLCRNAGIRELERQLDVGGHTWLGRVDYAIRRIKLLIEVDSVLHHTSVTDRANDRARDDAMAAAGWNQVLRITEEDIWYRPWRVPELVWPAIRELERAA